MGSERGEPVPTLTTTGSHPTLLEEASPMYPESRVTHLLSKGKIVSDLEVSKEELLERLDDYASGELVSKIGFWSASPRENINSPLIWWSSGMYRLYGKNPRDYSGPPSYEEFIEWVDTDEKKEEFNVAVALCSTIGKPYSIRYSIQGGKRTLLAEGQARMSPDGTRVERFYGTARDITVQVQLEELDKRHRNLIDMLEQQAAMATWVCDSKGVVEYVSPGAATLFGYQPSELVGTIAFDMHPCDDLVRIRDYLRSLKEAQKQDRLLSGGAPPRRPNEMGGGGTQEHRDSPIYSHLDGSECSTSSDSGEHPYMETSRPLCYRRKHQNGHYATVVAHWRLKDSSYYFQEQSITDEIQAQAMKEKHMYITRVAHDLKTPITTFKLALDYLEGTQLTEDQMDVVHQAKVETEFMSMLIMQTLDVGKMAMGQQLKPQLGLVDIWELVKRCQVILRQYPKQVPIDFEISPDLVLRVFTDGNWLWEMCVNLLTNACKFTLEGHIKMGLSVEDEQIKVEVSDTGIGISDLQKSKLFHPFSQAQSRAGGTGIGLFNVRQKCTMLGGDCGVRENPLGQGSLFWIKIPYVPDHHAEDTREHRDHTEVKPDRLQAPLGLGGPASQRRRSASPPSLALAPGDQGGIPPPSPSRVFRNGYVRKPDTQIGPARPGAVKDGAQRKTALVVDDANTIRKLLSRTLRQQGFDTYEACNGAEGLKILQQGQVDMCLLDYFMPMMDGLEMARRFRVWERRERPGKHQYIIGMSANAELGDINDGKVAGMDTFLGKPIKVEWLISLINGTPNVGTSGTAVNWCPSPTAPNAPSSKSPLPYEPPPMPSPHLGGVPSPGPLGSDQSDRQITDGTQVLRRALNNSLT